MASILRYLPQYNATVWAPSKPAAAVVEASRPVDARMAMFLVALIFKDCVFKDRGLKSDCVVRERMRVTDGEGQRAEKQQDKTATRRHTTGINKTSRNPQKSLAGRPFKSRSF